MRRIYRPTAAPYSGTASASAEWSLHYHYSEDSGPTIFWRASVSIKKKPLAAVPRHTTQFHPQLPSRLQPRPGLLLTKNLRGDLIHLNLN
jgi:hypothetical protein